MIKNELRIGNYVGHHDSDYTDDPKEIHFMDKVAELHERTASLKSGSCSNISCSYDELIPIPLSSKILDKCKENYKMFYYAPGPGVIEIQLDGLKIMISGKVEIDGINIKRPMEINELPPLRYLHQFQNLYFSLTGKELKIKL